METIKGRGAQVNTHNRFLHTSILYDDFLNYCKKEGESADSNKANYLEILNNLFKRLLSGKKTLFLDERKLR